MTQFYNRPGEKDLRRRLRKEMPSAEVLLWSKLRAKQLFGTKFRRQYSVGPYCIDFYCAEARLAIELDGVSHFQAGAKEHDSERQRYIEAFRIRFLRFTNLDVYENLDNVIDAIHKATQDPPQSPLCKGGS